MFRIFVTKHLNSVGADFISARYTRILCKISIGDKSLYRIARRFFGTYIRTCLHKHMHTSFRQILLHTALKVLAVRQHACGFLPCLQQNYARKSAYISYEDRFLYFVNKKNLFSKDSKSLKTGSLLIMKRLAAWDGKLVLYRNLPPIRVLHRADIESAPTVFVTNKRNIYNSEFRIPNSEFYLNALIDSSIFAIFSRAFASFAFSASTCC